MSILGWLACWLGIGAILAEAEWQWHKKKGMPPSKGGFIVTLFLWPLLLFLAAVSGWTDKRPFD